MGWQWPVEHNWGIIVFGGAARTWNPGQSLPANNGAYPLLTTKNWHTEAGISLNGLFGLFRIDVARRLDQPATVLRIGVARLF